MDEKTYLKMHSGLERGDKKSVTVLGRTFQDWRVLKPRNILNKINDIPALRVKFSARTKV